MKSIGLIPAGLALVLSLASCDRAQAPANGTAAAASESATAETDAVKQAFATFNKAIAAKDLPTIKAQYADDAVMYIPGMAPFEGIDAIMGDYKNYAADPVGKYAPGAETVEVSPSGDMAYGEVRYQSTYTDPKTKAVVTEGRYNISVYEKQSDGSWKVVRDVNVPLPKAG